jgi:hypothetical protein
VKHDIILRHAQFKALKRQEDLRLCIQAHLLSVVKNQCPTWVTECPHPCRCTLLPSAHNTLSGSWVEHIFSVSLQTHPVIFIFISVPIHNTVHITPPIPCPTCVTKCVKIQQSVNTYRPESKETGMRYSASYLFCLRLSISKYRALKCWYCLLLRSHILEWIEPT